MTGARRFAALGRVWRWIRRRETLGYIDGLG